MLLADLFTTDDLYKLGGVVVMIGGVYLKLRLDIKGNTDSINRIDDERESNEAHSDREQAEFRKLSETVTGALSEIKEAMRNSAIDNSRTWQRVDNQSKEVSDIQRKLATLEARADIAFMVRQQDKAHE